MYHMSVATPALLRHNHTTELLYREIIAHQSYVRTILSVCTYIEKYSLIQGPNTFQQDTLACYTTPLSFQYILSYSC